MSTGLGRRVGGEAAKGLTDPIFRALALSIGSAVDSKKVEAREDVKDDPDFDLTSNLAGLIGSGLAGNIALPQPKNGRQP